MPDTDPASLLAARLSAAEAAALAASPDGRREWRPSTQRNDENEVAGYGVSAWPGDEPVAGGGLGALGLAIVTHIAARDPLSTLADVDADRWLLAMHRRALRDGDEVRTAVLARVIEVRTGAWPEPPPEPG